jgi:glucose/arabinose dehydrogenase
MRRTLSVLTATMLALAALTVPADAKVRPPDPRRLRVGWTAFATGLAEPLMATTPEKDPRLFVVEKGGRIKVVKNGALLPTPFLDISGLVDTAGVGGLLSVAFKPNYKTSGLFFVAYMDAAHVMHVARYHADPASDVADPAGVNVIDVPYPSASYHYGGQIAFGPGGFLFISTGDGSPIDVPGDQYDAAQNPGSLLGKVLRLNITTTTPGFEYSVPSSNPYFGQPGKYHEIYAIGFRNPWRFSFDRGVPNMWVGDVGEDNREEIDRFSQPGVNAGWDCREGTLDTSPGHSPAYGGSYCTGGTFTPPLYEYPHTTGCSVIGGYVYRGPAYAGLAAGKYLYGDYCTGKLWLLGDDAHGKLVNQAMGNFPRLILGFGRDAAGELYLAADDGNLYKLAFLLR